MKQAAGYVRKSTQGDDRQEHSLDQQKRDIQEAATVDGYEIVKWYEDKYTGSSIEQRKGLQSLLRAVEAGCKWDCLYVYDMSRLSRAGVAASAALKERIRGAGVRIEFVADDLPEDEDQAELMESLKDFQHGQYLKSLADGTTRGMEARARDGKPSTRPTWGYDRAVLGPKGERLLIIRDGKTVEHDPEFLARYNDMNRKARGALPWQLVPSLPERVMAVQRAYALAEEGFGYRAIGKRLDAENFPTARGGNWTVTTLKHILKNPAYIGTLFWGARGMGKHYRVIEGKRTKVRRNAKRRSEPNYADAVTYENAHEPLISRREWDKVQALIEKRSTEGPGRRSGKYLLSGLMYCPECGRKLYGMGGGRVYCPQGNVSGPDCSQPRTIRVSEFEPQMIEYLGTYFEEALGQFSERELVAGLKKKLEQRLGNPAKRVNHSKKIATLSNRIAENPDVAEPLMVELKRLQGEQEEASEPPQMLEVARAVKVAVGYGQEIRRQLNRGAEHAKSALNRVLERVEVDRKLGLLDVTFRRFLGCEEVRTITRLKPLSYDFSALAQPTVTIRFRAAE